MSQTHTQVIWTDQLDFVCLGNVAVLKYPSLRMLIIQRNPIFNDVLPREFNQSDHPASPVVMNLEIKVPKGVILELLFIQCLHRNCMVSKQEYKC